MELGIEFGLVEPIALNRIDDLHAFQSDIGKFLPCLYRESLLEGIVSNHESVDPVMRVVIVADPADDEDRYFGGFDGAVEGRPGQTNGFHHKLRTCCL